MLVIITVVMLTPVIPPGDSLHGACPAHSVEAVPQHAAQHLRGQAEEGGGGQEEAAGQDGGRKVSAGGFQDGWAGEGQCDRYVVV